MSKQSQRRDRSKYKHMQGRARMYYLTYFLMFPDGDTWVTQRPVANDLDVEIKNIIYGHSKKQDEWKERARMLWKFGDVWWKDKMGVEHRMVVETQKRNEKWGTGKKAGMGEIKRDPNQDPNRKGIII